MKFQIERQKIVDYGKQLMTENLTTGTGGNISIRIKDEEMMLITPSGIPYDKTTIADIVLMDFSGNVLEGLRNPSSEYDLHNIFYKQRTDINSVVHTHSEYATALACLHQEIPPLHYIIGGIGSKVKCCSYKTYGTLDLAEEALKTIQKDNGILLGNHGVLAIGHNLEKAFAVARDIEFLAKLYTRAKALGEPTLLTEQELKICIEKFKDYGQQ